MAITAALVKELRERTGAGMMECKKALVETEGDIEVAIENMRKAGVAKASKKAGRVAAEGLISISVSDDNKKAAIVEVNSETDFVSRGDEFKNFAQAVANVAMQEQPADLDALLALSLDDGTVENSCKSLIAKLGENMTVRRFTAINSEHFKASYLHGSRIGVIVEIENGNEALAKDVAMHIAATNPVCLDEDSVPTELLAKEKEIFTAEAENSGKPANIIEKMVEGKLKKFLKEITLLNQPFVKDPDQTIAALVKSANARIVRYQRLEVGEGIEKKQENFAEEVMSQVNG